MRLIAYCIILVLCMGIAAYSVVAYASLPLGTLVLPEMRATFERHSIEIYTHIFAAVTAMLLGPFQFSGRLRSARPQLHRWLGRIYLGVGVLIGGIAGFFMAFHAFGGWVARAGFAALALAWLFTGFQAYNSIRAGDVPSHRQWMMRNFALTLAAVSLRIWMPLAMVAGIPFETAYPPVAWLCWIPNLAVAEVLLRSGIQKNRPT